MDLLSYFLMSKTVTLGTSLFCSVKGTAGAWYKCKDLILMCLLLANVNTLFAMHVLNPESKIFLLSVTWVVGDKRVDYVCPLSSDSLKTMLNLILCSSPIPNREGFDILLDRLGRWWGVSLRDVITLFISSVLNWCQRDQRWRCLAFLSSLWLRREFIWHPSG